MVSLPTCEKFSERLSQVGGFLVRFKEGVATGVLRRCKKRRYFLAWGFKELRWCLELSGTLGKLGYFDQSIRAAISLKRV